MAQDKKALRQIAGALFYCLNDGGSQMSDKKCFVDAEDQELSYGDTPVLRATNEMNHKIEIDPFEEIAMEYGA